MLANCSTSSVVVPVVVYSSRYAHSSHDTYDDTPSKIFLLGRLPFFCMCLATIWAGVLKFGLVRRVTSLNHIDACICSFLDWNSCPCIAVFCCIYSTHVTADLRFSLFFCIMSKNSPVLIKNSHRFSGDISNISLSELFVVSS